MVGQGDREDSDNKNRIYLKTNQSGWTRWTKEEYRILRREEKWIHRRKRDNFLNEETSNDQNNWNPFNRNEGAGKDDDDDAVP